MKCIEMNSQRFRSVLVSDCISMRIKIARLFICISVFSFKSWVNIHLLAILNCHISGIICVFTSSIPRKENCHKLLLSLFCYFCWIFKVILIIFKVLLFYRKVSGLIWFLNIFI